MSQARRDRRKLKNKSFGDIKVITGFDSIKELLDYTSQEVDVNEFVSKYQNKGMSDEKIKSLVGSVLLHFTGAELKYKFIDYGVRYCGIHQDINVASEFINYLPLMKMMDKRLAPSTK